MSPTLWGDGVKLATCNRGKMRELRSFCVRRGDLGFDTCFCIQSEYRRRLWYLGFR